MEGPGGDLAATTAATGGMVLYLSTIHGDIPVQLPVDDPDQASVVESDEYGNVTAGTPARYAWLGAKQRSAETLTGLVLMGVRLYHPGTGRFLTTDPVPGGNPNTYTYPLDPINTYDLDGRFGWGWAKKTFRRAKRFVKTHRVAIASISAGAACGFFTAGTTAAACAFAAGSAAGAGAKWAGNRHATRKQIWTAAGYGALGGGPGGLFIGAGAKRTIFKIGTRRHRHSVHHRKPNKGRRAHKRGWNHWW